jgi:hypothetical protein
LLWDLDKGNFVSWDDKKDDLKRLKFENGNAIPNEYIYYV